MIMLQFTIDPDALVDVIHRDDWGAFVKRLDRFWRSQGVLVVPSNFKESLDQSQLSTERRKEWITILSQNSYRKNPMSKPLFGNKLTSWQDLQGFDDLIDVAAVNESSLLGLGLASMDTHCGHDKSGMTTVEVTRGIHLSITCKVLAAEDLGTQAIPPEEPPDEIWENRLKRHAIYSNSVAVIDAYAIGNMDGLLFLIEKLVTDGWRNPKLYQTVDVYSAYSTFSGRGPDAPPSIRRRLKTEAQRLTSLLGSNFPKVSIRVNLLHSKDIRDVTHDRWIRYNENIIELGDGLRVLQASNRGALNFTLKRNDSERKKQEGWLSSLCRNQKDDDTSFLQVYSHPPK